MIGEFPKILSFNRPLLKLNCFVCNQVSVLPFIDADKYKSNSFFLRERGKKIKLLDISVLIELVSTPNLWKQATCEHKVSGLPQRDPRCGPLQLLAYGWFTLWTIKLDHGYVRQFIGC